MGHQWKVFVRSFLQAATRRPDEPIRQMPTEWQMTHLRRAASLSLALKSTRRRRSCNRIRCTKTISGTRWSIIKISIIEFMDIRSTNNRILINRPPNDKSNNNGDCAIDRSPFTVDLVRAGDRPLEAFRRYQALLPSSSWFWFSVDLS